MSQDAMRSCENRLRRLERCNRLLFAALGVCLVACVLGANLEIARRWPQVIQAERIVLVDPVGNDRAILALVDGQPSLYFCDKAGVIRLDLGIRADSRSGLSLLDGQMRQRFGVSTAAEGNPGMAFYDESQSRRAVLALEDTKRVSASGGAPVTLRSLPCLALFDPAGKRRIALTLDETHSLSLGKP